MFNRYFQEEIANLRDLGDAFSKAHPAVAPMLSGAAADPDVERLLEGVAFLTALLRQKLDDEFPEVIHELIQLIWPHYLRPLPSATIVAFSPKPMLKQSMTVQKGIQIASVPVEGTSCLFQTCYDVEIHPLHLLQASFSESPGQAPVIKMSLELRGLKLSDWQPRALRFFLAGNYGGAAELYYLLLRHLKEIQITPVDSGSDCILPAECLTPAGFARDEGILPYPSHSFPGYRYLQEYFVLPEKFLFLDLKGWDRWKERGEGGRFEITFRLDSLPGPPPRIKKENFVLFASPAINIFSHEADPIRLDHRKTEYLVRPSGTNSSHYQVYSVEEVVGLIQGTAQQRTYLPFEVFNLEAKSDPVYHLAFRGSPLEVGYNVFLSVSYPPDAGAPGQETLSLQLTCTNGPLPESLQVGDICLPTSSSPEFAEFRNIRPTTINSPPPLGANLLWRLVSHLSLNALSLAKAENFRALLDLYVFPGTRDRAAVIANQKRIAGITDIEARGVNRLVSGILMRGQEIRMKLSQDHFAGQGDLFVFGSVLDFFLGVYGSMNTFTHFHVQEVTKGESYQWPVRIGDRFLI